MTGNGVPMHVMFVGSPGGRPFTIPDRDQVADAVTFCFDNFTMSDAQGYFAGRPVPTLTICIATFDTEAVIRLARRIGRQLGQLEIGLELAGCFYRIVATTPDS